MRVTNSMMFDMLTRDILRANEKLLGTYEEISSGKKINRPSDDPAKIPSIMVYNKILSGIEQYRRNMQFSRGELNTAEGALNGVANSYLRLRELTLSSSTDTGSGDSRSAASYEVNEIFSQLLSMGNTKVGDKYIFSGYLTTTQAFTSAGAYQGDTNELVVNIGADSTIKANVTGDDAFTYSDSTQLLSAVFSGSVVGTGNLDVGIVGSNPLRVVIDGTNDEPKQIRDTINAPMTKLYGNTDNIGVGTLTLQVGNGTVQELVVTNANNTPTLLAAAINALNMGIDARLATDTVTTQERILFRSTTSGETITIDVFADTDDDDLDTGGLSGLLHTSQKSNLTENALGIKATVINDTAGTRLLFRPTTEGTTPVITIDSDGDGNNTDASGLSQLYHASSAATNLSSTMNVFTIVDHLYNSLQTNDRDGIDVSIALLDGASDQLVNVIAEMGGRQNKISLQEEWTESFSVEATTLLSEMEDIDIIEVSTALAKQQITLQALQIATTKVFELNIFNLI